MHYTFETVSINYGFNGLNDGNLIRTLCHITVYQPVPVNFFYFLSVARERNISVKQKSDYCF
jgi:hypothetical protein